MATCSDLLQQPRSHRRPETLVKATWRGGGREEGLGINQNVSINRPNTMNTRILSARGRCKKEKPLPPKTKHFCVDQALLGFWLMGSSGFILACSHKGKCRYDVLTSSVSEGAATRATAFWWSVLSGSIFSFYCFVLYQLFISVAEHSWVVRNSSPSHWSNPTELCVKTGAARRSSRVDKATLCPRAKGAPSDNNTPHTVGQLGGVKFSWGTEYSSVRVTLLEKN